MKPPAVSLITRKVNPSQYKIVVQQLQNDKSPWVLVFLNAFHRGWKLTLSDGTVISDDRHFSVNGYSNAWIIEPSLENTYVLTLTLVSERYFYIGVVITIASLALTLIQVGRTWRTKDGNNI